MVMPERQTEREAKDQAVIRLKRAMRAIPSRYFFSRAEIHEAIQLLEGDVTADDLTRYHEASK